MFTDIILYFMICKTVFSIQSVPEEFLPEVRVGPSFVYCQIQLSQDSLFLHPASLIYHSKKIQHNVYITSFIIFFGNFWIFFQFQPKLKLIVYNESIIQTSSISTKMSKIQYNLNVDIVRDKKNNLNSKSYSVEEYSKYHLNLHQNLFLTTSKKEKVFNSDRFQILSVRMYVQNNFLQ